MKRNLLSFIFFSLISIELFSQNSKVQFQLFGHIQYNLDKVNTEKNSYFSIGEQDMFVTAQLHERISFLGETVVKYDAATSAKFAPSIERAQMKFDVNNNHSIVIGKMHTPLNYWNDVFHHGRLFFPTIDRPNALNTLVPLHTLGIRMQGQNMGDMNFGYDVVVGNGISSTDVYDANTNKAVAVGMHIKPMEGVRLSTSYYNDYLPTNKPGVHSGHSGIASAYKGALNFEMYSASVAAFMSKWEFLNEFGYNRTTTDSLGVANNLTNFTYLGVRVNDNITPYYVIDLTSMSDKDLHTTATDAYKMAVGCRYEFNERCIVKAQIEQFRSGMGHQHESHVPRYDFKFQLAYGF
ncbi:MAG: hypothetical protein FJX95_04045 [Bacteroidetes bacterium]|nr:hypothetical protein [Bacteroidota bacterium]